MKTFAVLNQKGGTGKTTVTINLAAQLATSGLRVLVIDIDPQGNATSGSGADKSLLQRGVYEALRGEATIADAMLCSLPYGYHLLGANSRLSGAEIELTSDPKWRESLRFAIQNMDDDFDFIFIDCPPSLGVLTVNALIAAELVLIPMQCEYFALEGLSALAETVRRLRNGWNPTLSIAGIIRSMIDQRNVLARDVSNELDLHFGDKVFRTSIPRNIRIAEAPGYQLPITRYAPSSSGADGYRQLGVEFLERFA